MKAKIVCVCGETSWTMDEHHMHRARKLLELAARLDSFVTPMAIVQMAQTDAAHQIALVRA